MKKLVINTDYGGFSLSDKAIMLYGRLSGASEVLYAGRDLRRDDPHLITVVETLGEAANGGVARLEIIEVPSDVRCRIVEPDDAGKECVEREDRIVWDY
jgi:hypothetical protein